MRENRFRRSSPGFQHGNNIYGGTADCEFFTKSGAYSKIAFCKQTDVLEIDLSFEDDFCWPCHVDQIRLPIPFDGQVAAEKLDGYRAFFDPLVPQGCYGYGAGSGSAGKGFSAAALPDTHLYGVVIQDFDKFGVYPVREAAVVFELWSDFFDFHSLKISVIRYDGVWIAHGDSGHFPGFSGCFDFF